MRPELNVTRSKYGATSDGGGTSNPAAWERPSKKLTDSAENKYGATSDGGGTSNPAAWERPSKENKSLVKKPEDATETIYRAEPRIKTTTQDPGEAMTDSRSKSKEPNSTEREKLTAVRGQTNFSDCDGGACSLQQ